MSRKAYRAPQAPELVRVVDDLAALAAIVGKPDPHYALAAHPRRRNHKLRRSHDENIRIGQRVSDHRTQEQREQDIYGSWYPFFVAMKAEQRNAARVAKAQATLRYLKKRS